MMQHFNLPHEGTAGYQCNEERLDVSGRMLHSMLHYMSFSRRFYPNRLTISAFQPRVQTKNN